MYKLSTTHALPAFIEGLFYANAGKGTYITKDVLALLIAYALLPQSKIGVYTRATVYLWTMIVADVAVIIMIGSTHDEYYLGNVIYAGLILLILTWIAAWNYFQGGRAQDRLAMKVVSRKSKLSVQYDGEFLSLTYTYKNLTYLHLSMNCYGNITASSDLLGLDELTAIEEQAHSICERMDFWKED